MAINFLSVLGTVVCPQLLSPQAKTEPSSNKPNEWQSPALIAINFLSVLGTAVCPYYYNPKLRQNHLLINLMNGKHQH